MYATKIAHNLILQLPYTVVRNSFIVVKKRANYELEDKSYIMCYYLLI